MAQDSGVLAYRMVLAALQDDDEAYDEARSELDYLDCLPVIDLLVDGLAGALTAQHQVMPDIGRELAIRQVEGLLMERLDSSG